MALTFKTPGVYVQEISKLPPSVAEVETAIPAFIGYTEIAKNKIAGDLNLVPTRITSLLEYETYFGFADNEEHITVDVNTDGTIIVHGPTHLQRSHFLMYYSMQMYFANGGGPCYITSVGDYSTNPDFDELIDGLDEIKKQDEPTLLLFPDATFLGSESQFYSLFSAALEQCEELQDRFTIIDMYTDLPASINNFRDEITNEQDQLKYGAAYYPSLQTILSYKYLDSQVAVNDVLAPAYDTQVQTISNSIQTSSLTALLDDFNNEKSLLDDIDGTTPDPDVEAAAFIGPITAKVTDILAYMSGLTAKITQVSAIATEAITENPAVSPTALNAATLAMTNWRGTNITTPQASITPDNLDLSNMDDETGYAIIQAKVQEIADALLVAGDPLDERVDDFKPAQLHAVVTALDPFTNGNAYLSSYELNNNVMYNRIKAEIAQLNVVLPPSSAVAGVYARTDANKGVWTAPANASLNYTIAPTVFIDNQMQDGMNVTTTGKSVNAIRSFTGRGTLIWGARTLTGNSNEWRYVPVRRFFNFAEESIKKASEPFVFQSNDANTWVKVRGMIENFLTQQWKNGALQGAKAEQAFYVSVGLGQTMTAQDVLEGRMIVEIGMAVVRPAEFIILRFSHKMPEA